MKTKHSVRIVVGQATVKNNGLAERIRDILPFEIAWSELSIPQVVMVWLAMRELTGDEKAGVALEALMEVNGQ